MPIDIILDDARASIDDLKKLDILLEDFRIRFPQILIDKFPTFLVKMLQLTLARQTIPPVLAAISGFKPKQQNPGITMAMDMKAVKLSRGVVQIMAQRYRTALLWRRLNYGYKTILTSSQMTKLTKQGINIPNKQVRSGMVSYQPINILQRMFTGNKAKIQYELETRAKEMLKRIGKRL